MSRFKIGSVFGDEWRRTSSIAQGCPLSVMWANMVGSIWAKVMTLELLKVDKVIFVDDKSIRTKESESFERAFKVTAEFDDLCGQKLNVGKVVAVATKVKVGGLLIARA